MTVSDQTSVLQSPCPNLIPLPITHRIYTSLLHSQLDKDEVNVPSEASLLLLVLTLQGDEVRPELLGYLHEVPGVILNINCSRRYTQQHSESPVR